MVGNEPALSLYRGVKRGDVRITDDGLGRDRQRLVVDSRKDANHSVAAAQTPKAVDFRVAQRGIDVAQSVTVVSGEISDLVARVREDDRLPTECARILLCA